VLPHRIWQTLQEGLPPLRTILAEELANEH
jgi:hypothetical protein